MRVLVQIISFSCFLFSDTFVQSQECLREDIKYENTEPVEKASYADGETVGVNCLTGYTGLYNLKCEKGEWKSSIEQPCAKKNCGHPGNIPNGDLKLNEGIEYVFGVTVVYTCKKGYEMTSGINWRSCRAQGWDNAVPVCEVVKCPAISTDGEVTASGNTEEGRYGDVIHFECVSSDKMIDGSSDIRCEETGKWSDVVPKCKEVTCKFESTIFRLKRINPVGKTVFKVGESVEIFCSEKHLFFTTETNKSFTCQINGKWDRKPVCEITCEVPRDQHVSGPEYSFRGDMKLGAKRSYSCESGYRGTAAEATCTQDGWTPKPLCAEMMCDPPRIPNAEIVGGQRINYKIGSRIEYKCRSGFEPEEPVQITCDSQGQWTGIQQCTNGICQEQELKNIEILFGYPKFTSPYKPGQILVFRCTDDNMRFYGQHSIKCLPDGRWNYPYPQCGGKVQCSQPTKNLQFVTLSDDKTEYSNFEILTYTCNKPYNEIPRGVLMCQNGNWNGTFDCKSKICPPPPYLQHGDYSISSTKDEVITAVSYTCQSYYVLTKQQDVYKCVDGKWETPPKCLRPCEIDDIVEKYNLQLPKEKVYIRHAEKYRLNCRDGWITRSGMKTYVDVSCSNGNLQIDKSCDIHNN
ncbi:complement factor H-like isoform X1 [Cyprinus carpio]|uniref:Complement factor H-like isoform X1 n=1 Tax=Cyprinus carpio TaxID=7962 RepID=A0A9Q9VNF0_CYPCA|nr:complement factor H-like isoform X1 [Cyprinus carpio]